MTNIPDYINKRIRKPIPSGLCVVPGSTPIVAFGDARTAKVATLGLNPSSLEFQDRSGNDLVGCFRRLATHSSLGVEDLANAPPATIAQVLKECNSYFECNPYEWFNDLELILNACGRRILMVPPVIWTWFNGPPSQRGPNYPLQRKTAFSIAIYLFSKSNFAMKTSNYCLSTEDALPKSSRAPFVRNSRNCALLKYLESPLACLKESFLAVFA